jgi:hypothetical protein
MLQRRRLLITLVLLLAIGLAGLFLFLRTLGPGITRANFDRIADGDNRAVVEELLGGPPRDQSPDGTNWSEQHNGKLAPGHTREIWGGDYGAAILVFDEQGRVAHKSWMDSPETLLDRLRRRLFWIRL